MKKKQVLSSAISGLLAFGLVGNATAADSKTEMEKCYGVAKAGMNDCGGKMSGHSCAGQSVKNSDTNDFVALPKGTCNKLTNGAMTNNGDMMKKGM